MNRLTQKSYPDTSTVNYTYDLDSRVTQVTDPTGTYGFTFDNMGRLTGTSVAYTFLTARTFTTSYGYDAASNRTGFTDPENGATAYIYDTLNRLWTLTPPTAFSGTGSFGFNYDELSRRKQMTRPNNITTNYGYDTLSHLTGVLHQSGSTTLDGASYVPDNAGNRKSKTDLLAGVTSNYGYDDIYELKQVMQGANTTESYTYDPVGNRLTSLAGNYGINTSNQLTSSPSATFQYDYNGNTTSKTVGTDTTRYAWDYENHLTSVTLPGTGGTVTFKYDPFGRRIYKSSSLGTSIFAYDGDNQIEETNSSGAVVARYTQTEELDEPLAMLRSGATSFYEQDGIGSVTSLSNATGALAQTYGYDSFGRQTSSSGTLTNPFRFTARDFDTETNLQFSRNRYYDPTVGRFLSEDPIRFDGGVDFYAYVENAPTILTDPYGMDPNGWGPIVNWFRLFWPGSQVLVPGVAGQLHCTTPSECNFQPDMLKSLLRLQNCLGRQINITCGNGQHGADDPHSKGLGADIGLNSNPWLKRGDAERCFADSFPQGPGGSYAQQEYNSSDPTKGTHIHIQYTPGQGVAHGFAPGIKPHGKSKPKPKPCGCTE